MEISELSELVRKTWPGWDIGKRIGRGSYGTVYEAVSAEEKAAIKLIQIPQDEAELDLLRAEGYSEEAVQAELKSIRREYEDEIRVMQSMRDAENVVRIDDFSVTKKNTAGWIILIRMELLTPVTEYFAALESDDDGALAYEVTVLGRDICQALAACEEKKIIHRDIKPENLFTDTHGNYKLGDFGSARQHATMESMVSMRGTFNYMAPETYNRTGWYGPSTDLYSLGLVMYRYLNRNRLPFLDPDKQILSSAEREEALRRRMKGETLPKPCQASEALSALILRACAYEPENRFQSANEMKEALGEILQGNRQMTEPVREKEQVWSGSMPESGAGKTGAEKAQSKKITAGIAIVVLIAVVACLCVVVPLRKDRQTESSIGTESTGTLQTEPESTDTLQTETESMDGRQTENAGVQQQESNEKAETEDADEESGS